MLEVERLGIAAVQSSSEQTPQFASRGRAGVVQACHSLSLVCHILSKPLTSSIHNMERNVYNYKTLRRRSPPIHR